MTVIGTRMPRKEDPRLLRGRGRFGDDFSAAGQVWARVVRSPIAHGHLRRVDLTRARRADGVMAAVAAGDVPAGLAIPVRLAVRDIDLSGYLQPVLATGVVRYVGEPVAVVVAGDPYAAEDAAELVEIDIDEEPAVLDAAAAASPGSPRLFPAGNVAADFTLGYGDTETAFRQAAHVVETEVEIGRHTGVPLEPRVLLAEPDPRTGGLSIFGMTKVPVFNRDLLAAMLGMDGALIHVHAIDAGGGFGVRGEFYPEDFLVPWLARTLGRPVKWAEDRAEHLVAANHSRQQSHRVSRRVRLPRPDHRPGRRGGARQRRLLPHARHRGARADGGDAARPLPGARLPRPDPGHAHQQDALRHLPGARAGTRAPPRASSCSTSPPTGWASTGSSCAAATCWARASFRTAAP